MANSKKDYARLGKEVEDFLEYDMASLHRLAGRSFFRGIFIGLGSVIGATVMVALLLGILSLFVDLPGVGRYFQNFQETIKEQRPGA